MLKHIVMVKFIDYSNEEKSKIISEFDLKLKNLCNYISEILKLETGININERESGFDFILNIDFENKNSLDTYLNHPEHLKLIYFLEALKIEIGVVDYYI